MCSTSTTIPKIYAGCEANILLGVLHNLDELAGSIQIKVSMLTLNIVYKLYQRLLDVQHRIMNR